MNATDDDQDLCECCGVQLELGEDRVCESCMGSGVGAGHEEDPDNNPD